MPISDVQLALAHARAELAALRVRLARPADNRDSPPTPRRGRARTTASEVAVTTLGPVGAGAGGEDFVLTAWGPGPGSIQHPAGGDATRDELTTYLIATPPPLPGPIPPDQIASAKRLRAKAEELARQIHGAPFRGPDRLTQTQVYFEALRRLGIEN
jgi:hypothetical protein